MTFHALPRSPMISHDLETGRLGRHCQGNEPGHHTPYLYNAAGRPELAQATLHKLLHMYSDSADGLPGNDDVGQQSAWCVFSARHHLPRPSIHLPGPSIALHRPSMPFHRPSMPVHRPSAAGTSSRRSITFHGLPFTFQALPSPSTALRLQVRLLGARPLSSRPLRRHLRARPPAHHLGRARPWQVHFLRNCRLTTVEHTPLISCCGLPPDHRRAHPSLMTLATSAGPVPRQLSARRRRRWRRPAGRPPARAAHSIHYRGEPERRGQVRVCRLLEWRSAQQVRSSLSS